MSNTGPNRGIPDSDLPEPVLPGTGDDDAIGRPLPGERGNDLPNLSDGVSPLGEPDPTRPGGGAMGNDFA